MTPHIAPNAEHHHWPSVPDVSHHNTGSRDTQRNAFKGDSSVGAGGDGSVHSLPLATICLNMAAAGDGTAVGIADAVRQQAIAHLVNCLSDDNRHVRRKGLDGIRKDLSARARAEDGAAAMRQAYIEMHVLLLRLFADPVESCRESAIEIVAAIFDRLEVVDTALPSLVPCLVQRLGQQDMVEQSEEVRLRLAELMLALLEKSGKSSAAYMEDYVRILQRTLLDPYPEVKKLSCRCAAKLAEAIPEHFHMQSESLVRPLLMTISHQHSKVRTDVIMTIGQVVRYGNGKSVDDVVSHLAQRLFDQAPAVRTAVVNVVGLWLLDLPDRYSYFHKLIPLLLTGLTDELPAVREQASNLWHDAGIKYLRENEDELKEREDFAAPEPQHYPPAVDRPNLGCRELVYRNISKILPGLMKDLLDWVAETRKKSAALLYTLLLNSESNLTQHVAAVLEGLYKASSDEEHEVVTYVEKCAELIGYFVHPNVWVRLVLASVTNSAASGASAQLHGGLLVLASAAASSELAALRQHVIDIAAALVRSDVCCSMQLNVQLKLLQCCTALVTVCRESVVDISFQLFKIVLTVMALCKDDDIKKKAREALNALAMAQTAKGVQELFDRHTLEVIASFSESYVTWHQHSTERLVFDTLLLEAGPAVGAVLEAAAPVMVANLRPEKDTEVRLKFLTLLGRLLQNAAGTLDSQSAFASYAGTVVRDMIAPNCTWKAGRSAAAIRTAALSCLWCLVRFSKLPAQQMLPLLDEQLPQLLSLVEDDVFDTRLLACRILGHLFTTATVAGSCCSSIDVHRLRNVYPNLLKRLDDSSDVVRVAAAKAFEAYFEFFAGGTSVNGASQELDLYRAHLEDAYRGLIVHLDDPDPAIRQAITDVLRKGALLKPDLLIQQVEAVQHKHRSPEYCLAVVNYAKSCLMATGK